MTRPLLTIAAPVALLVSLVALPASVAAAGCSLTATVDPGHAIALAGEGFPASAVATIAVVRNGAPEPPIEATADAAGAFVASVDAGPGRGGAYSFSAVAGGCTATADAVAVETAGGGIASSGPGATMPPTDTLATAASPDVPGPPAIGALAIGALALGALAFVGLRFVSGGRSGGAGSPSSDRERRISRRW